MIGGISPSTTKRTETSGDPKGTHRLPDPELDRDLFLKLLVTQMRYQDPLQPTDDRTFLTELAQFTALERLTVLTETLATSQKLQAAGLLGREVELLEGTVDRVIGIRFEAGGPVFRLSGGKSVTLRSIAGVHEEAPAE